MSAPRPPVITAARGKSALSRIRHKTVALVKATITDDFSSLANWVVLSGEPAITSGRLSGSGFAVRHRDQLATDNYVVTATIGERNVGKTWLATCGSVTMDRFYALEVETYPVGGKLSIVKGTSVQASSSTGLLGIIIGVVDLFLEVLSDLFYNIVRFANVSIGVDEGDTVGVWFDEEASVVRGYKNGAEVTSLPVEAWEIPHGTGFRHFGVVASPDALGGVEFTSIEAADA